LQKQGKESYMKTQSTSSALVRRFSLIEWTYWSINGSFRSYVMAYTLSRGYAQSWASNMLAIASLSGLLGLVFWSALSDRLRTNRKTFLACLALILVANLGMFFVPNQTVYFWMYMLLGFVDGAAAVILDTWILRSLDSDMTVFSKMRATGSIGYALTMLLMGPLIERIGYVVMPLVSTIMVAVSFIAAAGMPDVQVSAWPEKKSKGNLLEHFSLLKIPQFVLLLAVMTLLGFAVSPVNSFKIVLLQNVGVSVGWQGFDSFVSCTLTFFAFRFAPVLLKRVSTQYQLLICSLLALAGILLDYTAQAPWCVTLGSCAIMMNYTVLTAGSRQVVMNVIPRQQQTVANSLTDACYGSVASLISLMYAGRIAENYGIRMMIFVSGLFAAGAVLVSLLAVMQRRSKNNTAVHR